MKQIKTIKRDFHTGAHTIPSLNLGSLAKLAAALRARAAAVALLADQAFRYSCLALAVVVSDIVGLVTAVSTNFAGVEPAASAIVGLDLVTLAEAAAAARRSGPGPRPVLLTDQAFGDARLPLAVVVVNIVGVVPAVSTNFARVELASASVVCFYLISFSEAITASAVGIAAPAVERRD